MDATNAHASVLVLTALVSESVLQDRDGDDDDGERTVHASGALVPNVKRQPL